jgi:hypothetical protein
MLLSVEADLLSRTAKKIYLVNKGNGVGYCARSMIFHALILETVYFYMFILVFSFILTC